VSQGRLPAPILIQQPDRLGPLAAKLASAPRLAVDTESNSLYSYRERVCLIQISIPHTDYLIDPLALPDLQPLAPLFSSPKIEKVFHAAEYDLLCLKRDFGFKVVHLFDTHIASRTLGRPKTGLGDLLEEAFNVRLDKKYQRANWGKRPLATDLLNYARLDTHYLLALRDRLEKELRRRERWEEAKEAFDFVARVAPRSNGFDPDGFWRMTNARRLTPAQAAILRELYLFREEQARRLDRPSFKILEDKAMLAAAQSQPARPADLAALPGITQGQVDRFGQGMLEAIARGRKAPRPQRTASTHVEEAVLNRFEKLRRWRQRAAHARAVESDVILPRDILWKIAQEGPRELPALRRAMAPLEWRFRTYGQEILDAL
jgi:ribonuclease D